MSAGIKATNDLARLRPTGDLGIYQVRPLKDSLLEALARHRCLEIDLSDVNSVDAASLQVFALAHREAVRAGKTLRIRGGNPAWFRLVTVLGMQAYFGDSLESPLPSEPLELEHEHGSASADIL